MPQVPPDPARTTPGTLGHQLRAAWAFVFRDYHLTRRYWSWVLVLTIPLGLLVFSRAETWAKRTGKLKRAG